MGMTGGLVRISMSDIERLRDSPADLPAFLEGNQWAPPLREVRPRGVLGWLLKLSPITVHEIDPTAVPPPGAQTAPDDNRVDLDKGWQGLHFLFTGTAWEGEEPWCFLARGGEEISDEDSDYSSIRVLTPDQVQHFAESLAGLSRAELQRRYHPERMKELEIFGEFDHLLAAFVALQEFASETARRREGALVYLT